jgi:hypothetical protein
MHNAIALGPKGLVHLVYYDLDVSRFKHTERTKTGWSTPKILGEAHMGRSDLLVDGSGDLHLVTFGYLNSEIIYLRRIGGQWKPKVVLESSANAVGPRPGMALDGTGTIHVSLCDASGQLKYLSGKGGIFGQAKVLATKLGIYCNNDLALDGAGAVHIVYLDGNARTLHHVGQVSGSFGSPKQLDTVGGSGLVANAIAATGTGDVWVAYFNASKGGLGLVRRKGGTWTSPQLVDYGGGRYLSAALGPQGELHVAHWHTVANKLRHTRICP